MIRGKNGFALSRTTDADSIDIALHEIPDGMYRTSSPYIVKKYYIQGGEKSEKYEIYHGKRRESGIKSVNYAKCGRVYKYGKSSISAAKRRHEIASEYEFFTHALNKKSEQIQCDDFEMNITAKAYAVCSEDYGEKRD